MDLHHLNPAANSPTSSTSSSTTVARNPITSAGSAASDPMQSWWESVSKARSSIHTLSSLLPPDPSFSLSSLADSDRPALSLLSSPAAYAAVSSALSAPASGSGSDPLCHWLYDTFLSSDPHLRLLVLSFLPLLSGLYLSRLHSSSTTAAASASLAGFEAVHLALYASETKSRAGKPVLISIPDLSQPSLYHVPRHQPAKSEQSMRSSVGVMCPPLEPQIAVKSTKRACIVGVALDCYYKQISQMPSWSKLEFCQFAAAWAGQDCSCKSEFDNNEDDHHQIGIEGFSESRVLENGHNGEIEDDISSEMRNLRIENDKNHENSESKGARIPLPWELLQPVSRILGHCLLAPLNSQDVKDAASVAVRCLYARASHELLPQAILATRSLIQLDKRARAAAKAVAVAAAANASSNTNTPSKAKKPEILLVSK